MTKAPTRRNWIRLALVLVGVTLLFLESEWHGNALVKRPPQALWLVALAIGGILGIGLSLFLARRVKEKLTFRNYLGLFAVPFICAAMSSYYLRRAVEAYAFVGVSPAERIVLVPVIRSSTRRHVRVTVQPDSLSREVDVSTSYELADRMQLYHKPGRDCLRLKMQTGRSGIARWVLPGAFEKAVDVFALTSCASRVEITPPPAVPQPPQGRR